MLSDFSAGNLLAGLLFGLIGLFVLRAAKREANLVGIATGLALMIYPYFVTSSWANWGIGIALTAIAFRALRGG